jgi:hypothetical protein
MLPASLLSMQMNAKSEVLARLCCWLSLLLKWSVTLTAVMLLFHAMSASAVGDAL